MSSKQQEALYYYQRIQIGLSRGATSFALRNTDPYRPASWEAGGFSQNGEDGIIDYLLKRLTTCNREFIEIGSADSLQNNTTWLAIVERYHGLLVDADRQAIHRANSYLMDK